MTEPRFGPGRSPSKNGGGRHFQPDISTAAEFLQARAALDGGTPVVLLDFEMRDFDPSPVTVGLQCSLANVRKLVHTCLKTLDYFGDQPASVLLKLLDEACEDDSGSDL